MQFLYTMRHPICNIVAFTNSINEVEKRSRDGWIINGKKDIVNNVYKH